MNKIGTKQLVQGEVALERLGEFRLSKRLRATMEEFRRAHTAYVTTSSEVTRTSAEIGRGAAMVHAADAALDEAVRDLADALVGARLGTRKNPFSSYSSYGPFRTTQLAYAKELRVVRLLLDRIERTKPSKQLAQVLNRCRQRADAVESALRAVSVPRARFQKARADLGIRTKEWREAFRRLKVEAAAYWIDDRATREAIFARPESIQRPVKRKRTRKKPAGALPVAARA